MKMVFNENKIKQEHFWIFIFHCMLEEVCFWDSMDLKFTILVVYVLLNWVFSFRFYRIEFI